MATENLLKELLLNPNIVGENHAKIYGADKQLDKVVSLAIEVFNTLSKEFQEKNIPFFTLEEFAFLHAVGNTKEDELKKVFLEYQYYKKKNPTIQNPTIQQYLNAKALQESIDYCNEAFKNLVEETDKNEEISNCIKPFQEKFDKGTIVINDYPTKTGGRKPRRRTNKKRRAKRKSLHRRR